MDTQKLDLRAAVFAEAGCLSDSSPDCCLVPGEGSPACRVGVRPIPAGNGLLHPPGTPARAKPGNRLLMMSSFQILLPPPGSVMSTPRLPPARRPSPSGDEPAGHDAVRYRLAAYEVLKAVAEVAATDQVMSPASPSIKGRYGDCLALHELSPPTSTSPEGSKSQPRPLPKPIRPTSSVIGTSGNPVGQMSRGSFDQ